MSRYLVHATFTVDIDNKGMAELCVSSSLHHMLKCIDSDILAYSTGDIEELEDLGDDFNEPTAT